MAVSTDILHSFARPRAVLRSLRDGERREARVLVYLMLACALIFVAQWPRLARQAHLDDSIPLDALLAGALFGWVFVAPLLFYAAAMLLALAMRLVAPVQPFDVRLALFWSLLVASPMVLLQGLVTGLIGPGAAALVTGIAVAGVFGAVLVAGLRVAVEAARIPA
jgi:hypothetical protein